jgi:hypothetical protein
MEGVDNLERNGWAQWVRQWTVKKIVMEIY